MRILAVWGLGKRGKGIINLIGTERIAVIIDQSETVQGTFYQGIQVISPELFLKEYRHCPVIVTPKYSADVILERLKRAGIEQPLSFEDEYFSLESLFRQVSIDQLIQSYEPSEELCIWGFNILGIVMYDILQEKGYPCAMVRGCRNDSALCQAQKRFPNVRTKAKEECQKEKCRILLAERMDESDKAFFADNKTERYYELAQDRERFYDPLLEQFHGIHKGKRCFIVATGPSLTVADLNTLHKNNEICISMNGIFSVFESTDWRPDYYMISDGQAAMKWKNEILTSRMKAKFISDTAWNLDEEEKTDDIFKWHLIKQSHLLKAGEEKTLPEFSADFSRGTYSGRTITYDGALQLAVYMGFSEICLLGVDCNYKRGSQNNYFYQEKEKDNIDHDEERMIMAYQSARNYADSHGIKIYNATRGGMLEVFDRVDFDSLFKGEAR